MDVRGTVRLDVSDMHIQVVLGDEGVILDVFDKGMILASTYKFWDEFGTCDECHAPHDNGGDDHCTQCGNCFEHCAQYQDCPDNKED